MYVKDCLTLEFCLISEIIHECCQADAFVTKETKIGFCHKDQYSKKTFQAEG